MFVLDMPNVPPSQYPPVMVAQVNQAKNHVVVERKIGVCHVVSNVGPLPPINEMGEYMIEPTGEARAYFQRVEKRAVEDGGKVTVLKQPLHGTLVDEGPGFRDGKLIEGSSHGFSYRPTPGYIGKDGATLLVEIGGFKVKVRYFFQVVDHNLGNDGFDKACRKARPNLKAPDYYQWKISSAPKITVSFDNLPGAAVGQTLDQGNDASIVLDANAGGHGWFIDTTPEDSSEFLPTSNANVWVAKAGTDAAGKMDMLSVLLHEYGHALGIEHSDDSSNFMSATLQPGERRLPSPEELTLMSQLVAELKQGSTSSDTPQSPFDPSLPLGAGFSFMALGRLRRTSFGSWALSYDNTKATAPSVPHYEVAVNSTLTNGKFNATESWATTGNVAIGNGAAILNETSTSQTRLNQVFIVGAQDRFLSFTLNGIALDDQVAGPDDAFEVGLLNANTGASLISPIGLSRTDALLNLQANGAELAAQGVTHITNPDGSRTYLVDLRGIASGTAVNLSFDLIGFGASGSHVAVSDVRLLGLPQTRDDSITTAEDTVAQIVALANDIDANHNNLWGRV